MAEVAGRGRSILPGERMALNFLGRLSGVATLTARYVRAVEGTGARILDTRKTTPGLRALEKQAVLAGGGTNHRVGLYDAILVKENHARAGGRGGGGDARARCASAPDGRAGRGRVRRRSTRCATRSRRARPDPARQHDARTSCARRWS